MKVVQHVRLLPMLMAMLGLAGCANPEVASRSPPMREGEGIVFVYRTGAVQEDRDHGFVIRQNGSRVGVLREGTFFYHYAKPGRHYYTAQARGPGSVPRKSGTFVAVTAGERHYIEATAAEGGRPIQAQAFVKYAQQARPTLTRLTPAEPDGP